MARKLQFYTSNNFYPVCAGKQLVVSRNKYENVENYIKEESSSAEDNQLPPEDDNAQRVQQRKQAKDQVKVPSPNSKVTRPSGNSYGS